MKREDINYLKEVLLNDSPLLFLGAGFSYGAILNNTGELIPTGEQLKMKLMEKFIINKVNPTDYKEISNENLRIVCECASQLNDEIDIKNWIISELKYAKPASFQYSITEYPWRKIYTINIDDIVEKVYSEKSKKLIVQNKDNKKKVDDKTTELIKLHGCVNDDASRIIFSETDYKKLLTTRELDYKLNDLMIDILNSSFIFIGANMDEPDIEEYLRVYEQAGYEMAKGKIIFINPNPVYKFKCMVARLNGRCIETTAEDFFYQVEKIKYTPGEKERQEELLKCKGIFKYKLLMQINSSKDVYESKIFLGYKSEWQDLKEDWLYKGTDYDSLIKMICKIDSEKFTFYNCYALSIFGKRLTGKGCLLKLLAAQLDRMRYEVFIYQGTHFSSATFMDYLKLSNYNKIALIIQNASFYYKDIEKLYKENFCKKKLLIVTSSRMYYHERKNII